jgi:hypothetical protein
MIDTLVKNYNLITKHTIRENNKKEGIEIYFTSIPSGLERQTLKDNNWRWSSFNKCWYIKKADLGIETTKETKKTKKENKVESDIVLEVEDTPVETKKKTTKASDKQVLATVNKILKYSEKVRPVLSAYTPLEDNKVAFTDSYRLCVLNRDSLPFKVAFNKELNNEKEYTKKHKDIEKMDGNYPNLKTIIDKLEDTDETFTFNVKEVKEKSKASGKKNKESRLMEFTTNKGNKIMLDSEYLKDMVTLLQIKDENVEMNYRGEVKPATYENENGFYLALPIKKY